jgi:hypothetical protein
LKSFHIARAQPERFQVQRLHDGYEAKQRRDRRGEQREK